MPMAQKSYFSASKFFRVTFLNFFHGFTFQFMLLFKQRRRTILVELFLKQFLMKISTFDSRRDNGLQHSRYQRVVKKSLVKKEAKIVHRDKRSKEFVENGVNPTRDRRPTDA
jgi:hypothetical protein